MEILVDTREPKTRRFNALCKYNEHSVEFEQLESADYVFNGEVAFEYKTISDFIGSTNRGRIFKQMTKQVETYLYNYLIIVGDEKDKLDAFAEANRHIRYNNKRHQQTILALSTYASIITAETETEAIENMLYVAEQTLKNKIQKTVKITHNTIIDFLSCIEKINTKTATRIVETLQLRYLNDLLAINETDLTTVDGVGEKTAKRIMEYIKV